MFVCVNVCEREMCMCGLEDTWALQALSTIYVCMYVFTFEAGSLTGLKLATSGRPTGQQPSLCLWAPMLGSQGQAFHAWPPNVGLGDGMQEDCQLNHLLSPHLVYFIGCSSLSTCHRAQHTAGSH